MHSLGNEGDINSQLSASVTFNHESYRDGSANTGDEEIQAAVYGHMGFASQIEQYYTGFIASDMNLLNDFMNLGESIKNGDMSLFTNYINSAYDNSADNWKPKIKAEYWD